MPALLGQKPSSRFIGHLVHPRVRHRTARPSGAPHSLFHSPNGAQKPFFTKDQEREEKEEEVLFSWKLKGTNTIHAAADSVKWCGLRPPQNELRPVHFQEYIKPPTVQPGKREVVTTEA